MSGEREALDERDLFRILMENVPDFIYFKDASGRFLRISRALASRYGLNEPDEAIGKTDFDFYDPTHARQFQQSEEKVLRTGEPLLGADEHNVDRQGHAKWVSTSKVAVRDAAGQIIGLLGITRDITARKDAEDRLVRSEKMASLGRLTAGIAHEMNTPLAAARAALAEVDQLLRELKESIGDAQITDDDQREIGDEMQVALGIANTAVERAAAFVRGMKTQTRDMARGERIRFDAVRIIGDALLLLRHDLRAKNCEVTFDHGGGGVELSGVPGRLVQVVSNLVGNAIDASAARGGGPIRVELFAREDGVELRIADSGTGISPQNLAKIFEPMFTTKPFGEGTGLGLTIVHDIVTGEFGGSVDVTSKEGQGTTFILRFPATMTTFGVGLVGYGLAGRAFHGLLVNATKGLEVRAVSTASAERGAQARTDFPDARIVAGFDELLRVEGLDLIVLGTPHDTHRELAVRALQAGLHVVTDKIMCLDVREADQMIEASRRAGKMLSVFHNRRWDSDFLTLRKCLAERLVGEPCVIDSAVLRAGPDAAPAPPPEQRPWRQRADKGGGPFRDWGAHLMDQAMILGGGMPESVYCDLQFRRPNLDVETLATCSMRFPSGLRVRIEAGAHSWIQRPRWYVQGTEGTIKMEGLDPQEAWLRKGEVVARSDRAKFDSARTEVISGSGAAHLDVVAGDYAAFYENIAAFLAGEAPLAVTPESCRDVLRVYAAAFESARRNEVVRVG